MSKTRCNSATVAALLAALAVALALPVHAQQVPTANGQWLPPHEIFSRFDRDGDGKLAKAEAPDRMQSRWDQIDANADGFATLAELEALPARTAPARSGTHPAFSVIVLGSGGPPYNAQRAGPSAVIQCRGRFVLVDMGNGTLARLSEAGISLPQIDAFVLTHHHRDHDEEFLPLLNAALVRDVPLAIVGPTGTARLVDFELDFHARDLAYRLERSGRKASDLRKPGVRELEGGESFTLGPLRIRTAQVPHSIHTVAYRFEYEGHSIVITGDLSYSEELIALANDTDVLVIDSGSSVVVRGGPDLAPGPQAAKGAQKAAHSTRQEVQRMAQRSRAKKLVMTHIGPIEVDEKATIDAIREVYPGEVVVAHDLLEVAPGGR